MDRLHAPPSIRVTRQQGGRERTLVDLSQADLRRYEMVLAQVLDRIERSLGPDVFANRAGPRRLRPWAPARRRWVRSLLDLYDPRETGWMLVTDVARCYASIRPAAVDAGLRRAGTGAGDRACVDAFLRVTADAGIDGLPVGPRPSAVLANAVLAIADDAARREGVRVLRWVDDVAMAGAEARVRRAHLAWLGAIRELGLDENEAKLRMVRARRGAFGEAPTTNSPSGHAMMPPP